MFLHHKCVPVLARSRLGLDRRLPARIFLARSLWSTQDAFSRLLGCYFPLQLIAGRLRCPVKLPLFSILFQLAHWPQFYPTLLAAVNSAAVISCRLRGRTEASFGRTPPFSFRFYS